MAGRIQARKKPKALQPLSVTQTHPPSKWLENLPRTGKAAPPTPHCAHVNQENFCRHAFCQSASTRKKSHYRASFSRRETAIKRRFFWPDTLQIPPGSTKYVPPVQHLTRPTDGKKRAWALRPKKPNIKTWGSCSDSDWGKARGGEVFFCRVGGKVAIRKKVMALQKRSNKPRPWRCPIPLTRSEQTRKIFSTGPELFIVGAGGWEGPRPPTTRFTSRGGCKIQGYRGERTRREKKKFDELD